MAIILQIASAQQLLDVTVRTGPLTKGPKTDYISSRQQKNWRVPVKKESIDDNGQLMRFADIARELNISTTRVNQLYYSAIVKVTRLLEKGGYSEKDIN